MTDEEIYCILLGGDVCIGKKLKSPLPPDDLHPSFWLFRGDDGKICWHDARLTEKANRSAIGLAMRLWECSYKQAIRRLKGTCQPPIRFSEESPKNREVYVSNELSRHELSFWNEHGITQRTLHRKNIFPLRGYYLGDEIIMKSSDESRAFIYVFGDNSWQIMRPDVPKVKRFKSVGVGNVLFGIDTIQSGGDLIITSSYKDAAVLAELGWNTVCPSGEGVHTSVLLLYKQLSLQYNNIYVLFDNDAVGQNSAFSLSAKINVQPIRLECSEKDPADLAKKYGISAVKDCLRIPVICNMCRKKSLPQNTLRLFSYS